MLCVLYLHKKPPGIAVDNESLVHSTQGLIVWSRKQQLEEQLQVQLRPTEDPRLCVNSEGLIE